MSEVIELGGDLFWSGRSSTLRRIGEFVRSRALPGSRLREVFAIDKCEKWSALHLWRLEELTHDELQELDALLVDLMNAKEGDRQSTVFVETPSIRRLLSERMDQLREESHSKDEWEN